MRMTLVVIILLAIIVIQLAGLGLVIRHYKRRDRLTRDRFATYLSSLDIENQRLKSGKEAAAPRKNYAELLKREHLK